ncbi:hypothetical protein T492DRAFT_39615 [Pavlovales sp. CCMP2436]|nr:hypothetical protein T492DRAFT_39615 [Pavlovales sp. CCMP2436]
MQTEQSVGSHTVGSGHGRQISAPTATSAAASKLAARAESAAGLLRVPRIVRELPDSPAVSRTPFPPSAASAGLGCALAVGGGSGAAPASLCLALACRCVRRLSSRSSCARNDFLGGYKYGHSGDGIRVRCKGPLTRAFFPTLGSCGDLSRDGHISRYLQTVSCG